MPKILLGFDNNIYNNKLQIINANNSKIITNFQISILKDSKSQRKGLMHVTNLPSNYGALFDFKKEKIAKMWMKNTFISLDMLFIDKNDEIIKIIKNTKPLSQDIISSKVKVAKILEINANIADKFNIKIGDKIKITQ